MSLLGRGERLFWGKREKTGHLPRKPLPAHGTPARSRRGADKGSAVPGMPAARAGNSRNAGQRAENALGIRERGREYRWDAPEMPAARAKEGGVTAAGVVRSLCRPAEDLPLRRPGRSAQRAPGNAQGTPAARRGVTVRQNGPPAGCGGRVLTAPKNPGLYTGAKSAIINKSMPAARRQKPRHKERSHRDAAQGAARRRRAHHPAGGSVQDQPDHHQLHPALRPAVGNRLCAAAQPARAVLCRLSGHDPALPQAGLPLRGEPLGRHLGAGGEPGGQHQHLRHQGAVRAARRGADCRLCRHPVRHRL